MNNCGQTHSTPRSRLCRWRKGVVAMCLVGAVLLPGASTCAQSAPATGPAAEGAPSAAAARLVGIPGVQAGMTTDQLLDAAVQAGRALRWADAERIVAEVVGEQPRNLKAYQLMAQIYELRAVNARASASGAAAEREAESSIDKAVRTYLEYAAPLARELGNLGAAEQMYKIVLQLRPNNPQAELGMARVLQAMGMQMQAIDRYRSYINPRNNAVGYQDAQAHLELGRVYRSRNLLNQAVAILEKARILDPENPDILLELAKAYQDTREYPKALELARSAAMDKAPNNASYHDVYAQVLLAQSMPLSRSAESLRTARQNLEESRRQAARAVELAAADVKADPGDSKRLNTQAGCYATFERVLRAVLLADETDVSARVDLAMVIREHGAVVAKQELHRALEALQQAGPTTRQNAAFLQRLAELQVEAGRAQAAAETCRDLLKLDPANAAAKRILESLATSGVGQPTGSGPASAPARR